jgi:hypothetical protein
VANQSLFFVISTARGQDFTLTEQIKPGGLTDGTRLSGIDNGSEFQTGQNLGVLGCPFRPLTGE